VVIEMALKAAALESVAVDAVVVAVVAVVIAVESIPPPFPLGITQGLLSFFHIHDGFNGFD